MKHHKITGTNILDLRLAGFELPAHVQESPLQLVRFLVAHLPAARKPLLRLGALLLNDTVAAVATVLQIVLANVLLHSTLHHSSVVGLLGQPQKICVKVPVCQDTCVSRYLWENIRYITRYCPCCHGIFSARRPRSASSRPNAWHIFSPRS